MHRMVKRQISRKKKTSLFDIGIMICLILIGIVVAYPLIFVVSASLSDPVEVNSGNVWLLPKGFQLKGYISVFKNRSVLVGYRNSLIYTVVGTFLNVLATVMAGYALSRKDLCGRKFWNWYIAIPMWFSGGLIPTYLTIHKLGLVNTPYILLLLGMAGGSKAGWRQ